MRRLNEFLKKYESLGSLAGIIVTIIGFFICTVTISNSINANVSNTNTNEVNINGLTEASVEQQFYEAQIYYQAGDYGNSMKIYQGIQNEHAVAKSNIGYLYAHGLGVEQSTRLASDYYKEAYEMGYEQALQNYISINLTAPYRYTSTLEALKYGYVQNNETAIRYLAACLRGKMPDVSSDKLKEMADEFMKLDTDTQLLNLKGILHFVNSEIVLFADDNPPEDSDFTKYLKIKQTTVKREISDYMLWTDSETNETFIIPLNASTEVYMYWKETYSFYYEEYSPADEFGKWYKRGAAL